MLLKFCKCGKIISQNKKRCDKCEAIYLVRQDRVNKDSYKRYKKNRTDIKEQRFYNSNDWKITRATIKNRDKGLCLLCLNKNKISYLDTVHHIIELKEDYTLRTNTTNLVSLCDRCHKRVHRTYNKSLKDKTEMQTLLRNCIKV